MSFVTHILVSDDKTRLSFEFEGRTWVLNYDGAAKYHAEQSTPKLKRLADCVPASATMIFDVGANCGLFAAMAAHRCPAAVHAFEPSAELHPFIHANAPAAVVHPLAVGETPGEVTFFVNRFSQQTNSLLESAVVPFGKPGSVDRRTVPQVSIDSFCDEHKVPSIDVLKLDVQGAEGHVFRGAKRMLPHTRLLLIETTWLELDSVLSVVPFARYYGFDHLGVVNPVYTGADLLLTRDAADLPADLLAKFDLRHPVPAWF